MNIIITEKAKTFLKKNNCSKLLLEVNVIEGQAC